MGEMATRERIILCQNIRLLRQTCGYSKRQMAALCRIGTATLNKIEMESFPPLLSSAVLEHLSQHFHLPPHHFFSPLPPEFLAALAAHPPKAPAPRQK